MAHVQINNTLFRESDLQHSCPIGYEICFFEITIGLVFKALQNKNILKKLRKSFPPLFEPLEKPIRCRLLFSAVPREETNVFSGTEHYDSCYIVDYCRRQIITD